MLRVFGLLFAPFPWPWLLFFTVLCEFPLLTCLSLDLGSQHVNFLFDGGCDEFVEDGFGRIVGVRRNRKCL